VHVKAPIWNLSFWLIYLCIPLWHYLDISATSGIEGKCMLTVHNFVRSRSDMLSSLVSLSAGGQCMFQL
jgi:hypothetical protein